MFRTARHGLVAGSLARRQLPMVIAVAATFLVTAAAYAQLPAARLFSVFPPGSQQGTEFEVTVRGKDLDDLSELRFSHPGITAVRKMIEPNGIWKQPRPSPDQFVITIKSDVPTGIHEVRAIGKYGISNPRAFTVSDVKELFETESNNTLEQAMEVPLDCIVSGQADNVNYDYFRLAMKKGQRVMAECRAYRIDSQMDPEMVLYDSRGREIDFGERTKRRMDSVLDFTAPADGDYCLKVYDLAYRGGPDYFYRLKISTGPYIDFIMPPAAMPGSQGSFTVFGRNLPGGKPAGLAVNGHPLDKVTVQITAPSESPGEFLSRSRLVEPESAAVDGFSYRLSSPRGTSNPVAIGLAAAPVVMEAESNDDASQAQPLSLPCEFVGQFYPQNDRDWLTFQANAGEEYWIEVYSQRFGVPTDPYMLLQEVRKDNDGNEQLTTITEAGTAPMNNLGDPSFNLATDDVSYRFQVPRDGTYRIMLRDLYYDGDPRFVYRLSIRHAQPDFDLAATPRFPSNNRNVVDMWSLMLRKGGTRMIEVLALRHDGFDGPIKVRVEGLPPGVDCRPATIGPQQTSASLVLKAADNAKPWAGTIRVIGKAKIGDRDVEYQAYGGSVVWPTVQNRMAAYSRLTRNIALAVSDVETAAFTVELGDGNVLEMSRAGTLKIPVKVIRRDGFKGNVTLPAVNIVANDSGRALTVAKGTNLAVNASTADATYQITIPNNAPIGPMSFHVQTTTQVDYSRNPEAVGQAEAEKKEIDQTVKEMTDAAKKAADDAKAAAQQSTEAQAKAKAAADAAKAARTKADAESDSAELRSAAEKAEKESTDAAAAVKTAEAKKAEADESVKDAQSLLDTAKKEQAAVAKRITDAKNAAKPKKINVFVPSTAVTVNITPAPAKMTIGSATPLKQGQQIEVPVTIERLYGYTDAVQLDFLPPKGVTGLKVNKVTIPKGQTQAKLVIEAANNATPGDHSPTVRATIRFNNQNLLIEDEFALKIDEVVEQK